jgi:diacylglycerol kinase (ATP)
VQAALIYNTYAGRVNVRRELASVVEYLEQNGWKVSFTETQKPKEAAALAHLAVQAGAQVVIAAGGDGTVNEVIGSLVHTDVVLGVLPVGTTNVWALQMRIPTVSPLFGPGPWLTKFMEDLEVRTDRVIPVNYYRTMLFDAARVLLEGQVHSVDVGQVNDRHFLMWAGVGLDAAVTENVSPVDKKNHGTWAFVGTALDTIREYESTTVKLTLDGQVREVETPLIIASNIQLYGGVLPIGARACVDDGKLDVCIFRGDVLRIVSRQHLRDPEIEYHQCQEVLVESAQALPVHADDEPFTKTPVAIRIVPRALKVIVPRNAPDYLFTH